MVERNVPFIVQGGPKELGINREPYLKLLKGEYYSTNFILIGVLNVVSRIARNIWRFCSKFNNFYYHYYSFFREAILYDIPLCSIPFNY